MIARAHRGLVQGGQRRAPEVRLGCDASRGAPAVDRRHARRGRVPQLLSSAVRLPELTQIAGRHPAECRLCGHGNRRPSSPQRPLGFTHLSQFDDEHVAQETEGS